MLRFSRSYLKYIVNIFLIWNETKKNTKSFYRKSIVSILQLNLNKQFQKLKLTFLTWHFSKLITNSILKCMQNRLTNKVICIANRYKTETMFHINIVIAILGMKFWVKTKLKTMKPKWLWLLLLIKFCHI